MMYNGSTGSPEIRVEQDGLSMLRPLGEVVPRMSRLTRIVWETTFTNRIVRVWPALDGYMTDSPRYGGFYRFEEIESLALLLPEWAETAEFVRFVLTPEGLLAILPTREVPLVLTDFGNYIAYAVKMPVWEIIWRTS